jgi:hypothetical protein
MNTLTRIARMAAQGEACRAKPLLELDDAYIRRGERE